MKAIFNALYLCALLSGCSAKIMPATTPITNQVITDSHGTTMLLGHCTQAALQQQPFSSWFDSAYQAYQPNTVQTDVLKEGLKNTTIEVFLGTWCGDSKREVPRLLKTLQQAGIDSNQIRLIMVHHEGAATKTSPLHEEKGKNIWRVPTAIFYKNKKEFGRIIEWPVENWEKDMAKITSDQPYTPHYNELTILTATLKNKTVKDATLQKWAIKYKEVYKNPNTINALGYLLLYQQQIQKAFQVFKLNTLLFPTDSNVWDSLAEAYNTVGNKVKAIALYNKVLQLDPRNSNAVAQIKSLSH